MKDKPQYNPYIHHRRSIRLKGFDYSQEGFYFITICCENRKHRFGEIENGEMILNECGQIAYNEWVKLSERFPNFELDVFQIMPNHIHGIIALVGATLAVAPNDVDDAVAPNDVDDTVAPNDVDDTVAPNDVDDSVAPNDVDDSVAPNDVDDAVAPNDVDDTVAPNDVDSHNDSVAPNDVDSHNDSVAPNNSDIRATARVAPTFIHTVSDMVGAYKSLVANGCLDIYKSKNQTMGKLWQRNYYEHIIRNEQSYLTISKYIMNNPSKWAEDKFYMK